MKPLLRLRLKRKLRRKSRKAEEMESILKSTLTMPLEVPRFVEEFFEVDVGSSREGKEARDDRVNDQTNVEKSHRLLHSFPKLTSAMRQSAWKPCRQGNT